MSQQENFGTNLPPRLLHRHLHRHQQQQQKLHSVEMAELRSISPHGPDADQQASSSHVQNDNYVSRMPSPPHLQLLRPPFTSANLLDGFTPPPGAALPRFLSSLNIHSLFAQDSVSLRWDYSYRYAAQAVLPFLYLGPRTVSKDLAFLRQAKISLIIALRHGDPADQKPAPQSLRTTSESLAIELAILDLKSKQCLIPTFTYANKIINNHLNLQNLDQASPSAPSVIKGAVLICCESGTELSAAVTIAYLMQTLALDLPRAHRLVQDQRFCISVNQNTAQILQSYGEILVATRDVSNLPTQNNDSMTLVQRDVKRSRDDDSDESMDEPPSANGAMPPESRTFTPFQD